MTKFTTRTFENTISGTFSEHEYELSEIEVTPGDVDENPEVAFTVKTPFGMERVWEVIFDGELVRDEGCWADRLTTIELDHEDLSELLTEVNGALRPVIAHTKLNLHAVEALAESAGLLFEFQDGSVNERWRLFDSETKEHISHACSLHVVLGDIQRYQDDR